MADTPDETVNGYFATANYLDKAVEEFFNYLKASGLYDNSVIVLYGDHYGVSNGRNRSLAELVGKTSSSWNDFDNAQMQRVPFMIHIPGQENGGINHTYGAQIDSLPTLLHLLGIDTQNYIQLGQDLFSNDHKDLAVFRDGSFMTSKYTFYNGTLYDNETQLPITEPSEELQAQIDELQKEANRQLEISDKINNGDLLRFHTGSGLEPIDPSEYSYKNIMERLLEQETTLGEQSTSVFSQNNNQSTVDLYDTKSYKDYHPSETSEETMTSSSESEAK
jgi:lipoteichoic acid synthase